MIVGNCTEYPTSRIPNGGNTQRPEYPTEKLVILVIGYSGQNDRNTQQQECPTSGMPNGNCTEYPTSGIPNDGIPNNGISSNYIRYNM